MKERPILMSGPMVRAILEGRKTQTRRVIKPKYDFYVDETPEGELWPFYETHVTAWSDRPEIVRCPYGYRNSHLWVRETFCDYGGKIIYRADYPGRFTPISDGIGGPWKPSIHMPRTFSRIKLKITGVRVERLNDISEEDAIAEGVRPLETTEGWNRFTIRLEDCSLNAPTAREVYAMLWDFINGPGSWDENYWVWVVGFRRGGGSR